MVRVRRELDVYEFERRLLSVLEPFREGSAYERAYVEREQVDGGTSRSVSCLSSRSKNHANADEVANELNRAHRLGVAMGAMTGGASYRQVWSGLMVAAFYDVLTTEQLEVFAVLSADRLGYTNEPFGPKSWFYGWNWDEHHDGGASLAELHALLMSACLLAVAK